MQYTCTITTDQTASDCIGPVPVQESKLHADYVTYKKYQNTAVAEIRKAKKSFEKKLSVNIKSDPRVLCLSA